MNEDNIFTNANVDDLEQIETVDEIVAVALKEIDSLIVYVKSLTASERFLDLEKEKKVMVNWLVDIKQMYGKATK